MYLPIIKNGRENLIGMFLRVLIILGKEIMVKSKERDFNEKTSLSILFDFPDAFGCGK